MPRTIQRLQSNLFKRITNNKDHLSTSRITPATADKEDGENAGNYDNKVVLCCDPMIVAFVLHIGKTVYFGFFVGVVVVVFLPGLVDHCK